MRQSVQELFEKYQNNLYAVAFNICKNAEDAKDIVQETFIQYYSLRKEFDNIGYKIKYKVLIASDYGVPQQRRRVVFIGFKKTEKKSQ